VPAATTSKTRPAHNHTPSPRPTSAVFTASRGRCWLLVRSGGPNGAVLWEGVLEQGQARTFPLRSRVWVRLGAPSAVDLRVGGRLVSGLASSPENLVLSRTGAQPA
jgi:hypothetical protein